MLINKIANEYGCYDDRIDEGQAAGVGHRPSLGEVAQRYGMGIVKVRKLLVTAGVYSTRKSRWIQKMQADGDSIDDIVKKTGLTKASVYSYLPYKHVVYNLSERSPESDRSRLYQKRRAIAGEIRHAVETFYQQDGHDMESNEAIAPDRLFELVKSAFYLFGGYYFETEEGKRFRINVDEQGVGFAEDGPRLSWEEINRIVGGDRDISGRTKDEYMEAVFKRIGAEGMLG